MSVNVIKVNNSDTNYTHSIFDISEYHIGQTYADLSAALSDVPQDKQIPGMTVRFVQTSDNKYLQYRHMSNTWSATETDWQGVDDNIKYQSKNLIESGSIATQKIYSSQISPSFIESKALTVDSSQFKIVNSAIKNVLVFRYDEISDYVNVEGIDYSSADTVWWLMKDWDNWVRDSYIGFYRRKIAGKLSSYSGLKYIAIEYRKDENVTFNPEKATIYWFSDEQTSNKAIASSSLLISYQTLENKAVTNFAVSDFNNYCIKQYHITEGDKYALSCSVSGGSNGFIAWWFGANDYPIKCEQRNTSGQMVRFRDIIMTAPKGAQYLFINSQMEYEDSCYVYSVTVIDAETEELNKNIEPNTIASSRLLKNRLLCEKLPGQFPSAVDGHIIYISSVDSYVFANIDPTKTYVCRGFAGNGGWTGTAFISYWNGDIWLGIDTNMYFPAIESGYVQEDDYLLHMPHNCNKVVIISNTVHCPTADLLSIATHINSQELLDSVSKRTKTEQTCTILAGQFPSYVDGQIMYNQHVDSFEFANIDPTKRYVAKGFGFNSAGYNALAFIHYYYDTTWLGIDEDIFVERGPYVQTEDYLMSIPENCNKIVIMSQHAVFMPTVDEVTLGNRISSQELKDDIDANTEAITEIIKTEQAYTILLGQFPQYLDGHIIYNQNVDSYEYSNINPNKKYLTKGFGFDSEGYNNLAFVHYYHDTTWLGIDEGIYFERGPYVQTEDYLIPIPENCNKIVIISQHNRYTPIINEITLGNRISSQKLKDNIDANTEAITEIKCDNSKLMKVTKTTGVIYVRTALNDNEDVIVSYVHLGNDQYTWGSVYLGSKTAQDNEILENEIKYMGDSTAAIGITDPAPWHLWAQHGYCIPFITATHGLTTDDIGSTWKDQRDRQYKIGNVSGDRIYLLPTIRDTEYPGVKTRDWKSPTTVNNPAITSLVHVSGAVHTTTINVTSWSDTQLRPMMVLDKRVFIADGKEITSDGIYYCDDFVISDTFKCTDPWTIETHFPAVVQKEIGAIFSQTFAIHGLSCRYDTTYDMKKSYLFSWYGIICIQHFVPTDKLPGYDVYGMLPRVNKNNYSTPYLVNNTSRNGEVVYRKQDELYDIDKQADRYITFFKNSTTGDMKIGCAGGYSLTRGMTKDSIRNTISRIYQSGDRDIASISPGLGNKAYLKAITDSNFENHILPSTFIGQFSTYLSYFNPMANIGQVYWYKDGNDYVIYAHYQEAHSKLAINLPKEMEGLSVDIVDSDDVTLITDIVNGRKIYVDVGNSGHSYIVLKTK